MQQRSSTPPRGAPERPGDEAGTSPPVERQFDGAEDGAIPDTADLVRRIEAELPEAFRIVTIAPADPAVAITPDPSLTADRALLALATNGTVVVLYQYPFSSVPASSGTATITEIVAQGTVERYDPIRLAGDPRGGTGAPSADGFMAVVTGGSGTETFYIIATGAGHYVFRTPLSSVQRSVLRDLDSDGVRELVQYSRVFEAGGKREVIIDTLRWTGTSFRYDRSLAVVRGINEELEKLGALLRAAQPGDRRFAETLQPQDGAPPAATVFPVQTVVIPEFSELLVDLGLERWSVAHEIALEGENGSVQVYRIRIEIEANPYRADPVTIVGLD